MEYKYLCNKSLGNYKILKIDEEYRAGVKKFLEYIYIQNINKLNSDYLTKRAFFEFLNLPQMVSKAIFYALVREKREYILFEEFVNGLCILFDKYIPHDNGKLINLLFKIFKFSNFEKEETKQVVKFHNDCNNSSDNEKINEINKKNSNCNSLVSINTSNNKLTNNININITSDKDPVDNNNLNNNFDDVKKTDKDYIIDDRNGFIIVKYLIIFLNNLVLKLFATSKNYNYNDFMSVCEEIKLVIKKMFGNKSEIFYEDFVRLIEAESELYFIIIYLFYSTSPINDSIINLIINHKNSNFLNDETNLAEEEFEDLGIHTIRQCSMKSLFDIENDMKAKQMSNLNHNKSNYPSKKNLHADVLNPGMESFLVENNYDLNNENKPKPNTSVNIKNSSKELKKMPEGQTCNNPNMSMNNFQAIKYDKSCNLNLKEFISPQSQRQKVFKSLDLIKFNLILETSKLERVFFFDKNAQIKYFNYSNDNSKRKRHNLNDGDNWQKNSTVGNSIMNKTMAKKKISGESLISNNNYSNLNSNLLNNKEKENYLSLNFQNFSSMNINFNNNVVKNYSNDNMPVVKHHNNTYNYTCNSNNTNNINKIIHQAKSNVDFNNSQNNYNSSKDIYNKGEYNLILSPISNRRLINKKNVNENYNKHLFINSNYNTNSNNIYHIKSDVINNNANNENLSNNMTIKSNNTNNLSNQNLNYSKLYSGKFSLNSSITNRNTNICSNNKLKYENNQQTSNNIGNIKNDWIVKILKDLNEKIIRIKQQKYRSSYFTIFYEVDNDSSYDNINNKTAHNRNSKNETNLIHLESKYSNKRITSKESYNSGHFKINDELIEENMHKNTTNKSRIDLNHSEPKNTSLINKHKSTNPMTSTCPSTRNNCYNETYEIYNSQTNSTLKINKEKDNGSRSVAPDKCVHKGKEIKKENSKSKSPNAGNKFDKDQNTTEKIFIDFQTEKSYSNCNKASNDIKNESNNYINILPAGRRDNQNHNEAQKEHFKKLEKHHIEPNKENKLKKRKVIYEIINPEKYLKCLGDLIKEFFVIFDYKNLGALELKTILNLKFSNIEIGDELMIDGNILYPVVVCQNQQSYNILFENDTERELFLKIYEQNILKKEVLKNYQLKEAIYRNSFVTINRGINIINSNPVEIKSYLKSEIKKEKIWFELMQQRDLGFILKFFKNIKFPKINYFENSETIFLVYENYEENQILLYFMNPKSKISKDISKYAKNITDLKVYKQIVKLIKFDENDYLNKTHLKNQNENNLSKTNFHNKNIGFTEVSVPRNKTTPDTDIKYKLSFFK